MKPPHTTSESLEMPRWHQDSGSSPRVSKLPYAACCMLAKSNEDNAVNIGLCHRPFPMDSPEMFAFRPK